MRVYSYVLAKDGGFAPNPFGGVCTLACCKPNIRRAASVGDVVVGLAPGGARVAYAMRVARVLGFDEYWRRYPAKRPRWESPREVDRVGDNIYEPVDGGFRQLASVHSRSDGSESRSNSVRDLGGAHVLVAERFAYFGRERPPLPAALAFLEVGRGHRCRFTPEQVGAVDRWFEGLSPGLHARPKLWPDDDTSWEPR